MLYKTQIVTHLLPYEMKQYNRIIQSLIFATEYFESSDINNVELYVTLNLSNYLINWNSSEIKINDILNEFNIINNQLDACKKIIIKSEIITDNSILGTTAQKRKAINNVENDIKNFIFLDSDIYFHPSSVKYLIEASKNINNKYYVITPQTVKLWDETWDVITHKKFQNESYGFEKTFNPEVVLTQDIDVDIGISEVPTFKFGCGWLTLYSSSLLKFLNVPDELGSYGSEDAFWMFASMIMKDRGYDVQQYMLDGLYIAEDLRGNSFRKKFTMIDMKKENYIKHDTPIFAIILQKFSNNLKYKDRTEKE